MNKNEKLFDVIGEADDIFVREAIDGQDAGITSEADFKRSIEQSLRDDEAEGFFAEVVEVDKAESRTISRSFRRGACVVAAAAALTIGLAAFDPLDMMKTTPEQSHSELQLINTQLQTNNDSLVYAEFIEDILPNCPVSEDMYVKELPVYAVKEISWDQISSMLDDYTRRCFGGKHSSIIRRNDSAYCTADDEKVQIEISRDGHVQLMINNALQKLPDDCAMDETLTREEMEERLLKIMDRCSDILFEAKRDVGKKNVSCLKYSTEYGYFNSSYYGWYSPSNSDDIAEELVKSSRPYWFLIDTNYMHTIYFTDDSAFDKLGSYPIISSEEARAELLAGTEGRFTSEDVTYAGITYYQNEEYYFPCYQYYVRLDNTSSSIPGYVTPYQIFHVPAVKPEYRTSEATYTVEATLPEHDHNENEKMPEIFNSGYSTISADLAASYEWDNNIVDPDNISEMNIYKSPSRTADKDMNAVEVNALRKKLHDDIVDYCKDIFGEEPEHVSVNIDNNSANAEFTHKGIYMSYGENGISIGFGSDNDEIPEKFNTNGVPDGETALEIMSYLQGKYKFGIDFDDPMIDVEMHEANDRIDFSYIIFEGNDPVYSKAHDFMSIWLIFEPLDDGTYTCKLDYFNRYKHPELEKLGSCPTRSIDEAKQMIADKYSSEVEGITADALVLENFFYGNIGNYTIPIYEFGYDIKMSYTDNVKHYKFDIDAVDRNILYEKFPE